ncbi:MAG: undecaprenyl-diphosphate phosphatase [Deltaproteobacteria bacterium]|nr:undecaprenyl-diphosphate phosphatase [Deltaproteobacteria bacterium]
MGYIAAIWLGILEGLTEFIPVSSTGHLILLGRALGLHGDKSDTFSIFIQSGAMLAVVALYYPRFLALFDIKESASSEASFRGWAGIYKLALACLPIFVMGGLFGSKVKALLFAPLPIALALIVGGVLLILLERYPRPVGVRVMEEITPLQCLWVGLFQCLALWPGMSRSGSTIIGSMLLGFERKLAAEFSFFIAVPTLSVAIAYDLLKSWNSLSATDIPDFAIGFVVSFLTAALSIKIFLAILSRCTMRPFGYYRIVLGLVVLWTVLS